VNLIVFTIPILLDKTAAVNTANLTANHIKNYCGQLKGERNDCFFGKEEAKRKLKDINLIANVRIVTSQK
jgi:hypothetical protein